VIANLRPLFSRCATPLCDERRSSFPTVIPSHYRSGLIRWSHPFGSQSNRGNRRAHGAGPPSQRRILVD
jgi:hypothetical protein